MFDHKKPVIGLISCSKELAGYRIQALNEFYIQAVKDFGGLPIVIPNLLESKEELNSLLALCDGIVFPGSHSNVAPHRYNATHDESKTDESRDELSLNLLRLAVDKNIPCLGICRGFQEMNVALGGSLNPAVHESGFDDHRESESKDFSHKYALSHPVIVKDAGLFQQWLTHSSFVSRQQFDVNTLHNQGVEKLAPSLFAEAVAPDGLIEAFSLPGHAFFVGVQWHPEWQAKDNPFSRILFSQFIAAAVKASCGGNE